MIICLNCLLRLSVNIFYIGINFKNFSVGVDKYDRKDKIIDIWGVY